MNHDEEDYTEEDYEALWELATRDYVKSEDFQEEKSAKSNFDGDAKFEKFISDNVLVPIVYPKLKELNLLDDFTSYSFANDEDKQMKGIDVDISFHNLRGEEQILHVDEKMASRWMNTNLQAFAFELGGLTGKGHFMPGWFTNPKKETTHYLFMWLTVDEKYTLPNINGENNQIRTNQLEALKIDEIRKIEFMLFKRFHILNYLKKCDITAQDLDRFAKDMVFKHLKDVETKPLKLTLEKYFESIQKNVKPSTNVEYLTSRISFIVNRSYGERPVIMKIQRPLLNAWARKIVNECPAVHFQLVHSSGEKEEWKIEMLDV